MAPAPESVHFAAADEPAPIRFELSYDDRPQEPHLINESVAALYRESEDEVSAEVPAIAEELLAEDLEEPLAVFEEPTAETDSPVIAQSPASAEAFSLSAPALETPPLPEPEIAPAAPALSNELLQEAAQEPAPAETAATPLAAQPEPTMTAPTQTVSQLDPLEARIPGIYRRMAMASGQAFLLIDKQGLQVSLYEGMHPLFGLLADREDALELLFHRGQATNRDSASFAMSKPDLDLIRDLMESVFSRITDIDVFTEMLPNELVLEGRVLRIRYEYVNAPAKAEDCILVVFNDISRERELQAQVVREKAYANMVAKAAWDLEGYANFYQSSQTSLAEMQKELEKPLEAIRLGSLLNVVDILSSGAELYEIIGLQEHAEGLETELEAIQKGEKTFDDDALLRIVQTLDGLKDLLEHAHSQYMADLIEGDELQVRGMLQVNPEKLNQFQAAFSEEIHQMLTKMDSIFEKNYLPFTKLPQLEQITQHRLQRIKSFLWEQLAPQAKKDLSKQIQDLKRQPLGLILRRWSMTAQSLARRLGKQVNLTLEGAEIDVDLHKLHDLFSAATHMVRNAVEHGLETMEERVFMGKDLEGRLSIKAWMEGDSLFLEFSDDGRGIDTKRLKQSLADKGLIPPEEMDQIADAEVLGMLFETDYSSKEGQQGKVKGAGTEAVSIAMARLGGSIQVESKLEAGTKITLRIPNLDLDAA